MKIKDIKANISFDKKEDINIIFTVDKAFNSVVQALLDIDKGNLPQYDLQVSKVRKKRSLDANAYCWVLLGKLAQKLKTTPDEIYMSYVLNTGSYFIQPVKKEVFEHWKYIWESGGIGNICVEIGDCKRTEGFVNTKCYYGSSKYDTEEMSHLIDLIVTDCKEQGIETMTPDELAELKSKWGGS